MSATALALELKGLSFTHSGATEEVLRGVDLDVAQGSFALLVGDTGSGKSTMLSLVKPQIAPAGSKQGSVRVFGRNVEDLSNEESARTVGFVFQDPDNQIVCDSVWHEMAFGLENLGVPAAEMRRRVAEAGYFFGMGDWFHSPTDALSGGCSRACCFWTSRRRSSTPLRPRTFCTRCFASTVSWAVRWWSPRTRPI